MIEGLLKKYNISDVTIYNYLKKYWIGGMTPIALMDMRIHSGGRGKEKNQGERKLGRRGSSGIPITSEVKSQIQKVLKDYYYNKEEATLSFAYEMLIYLYYSELQIQPDGRKVLFAKEKRLTKRQFHYWSKKLFTPTQHIKNKKGEKKFYKDHRGMEGSSIYEAIAVGTGYEIDSTTGDIYLVSEYDRQKIIGRPTIYMVVDVFSRLVVGFYVGLESQSSWFGAIQALVNTVKNKVELCKEYDIEIVDEQWPARYFPRSILADRAEFIGYNSDLLTKNFKIRVENTSSYRADMKGTVEKILHLIPKYIRPFTPGYIEPDYYERGGMDYRLDAKVTIKEFTWLIIKCILHYNDSYRESYPLSKEMIEDKLIPTPINLWSWGIKNNPSNLRSYPPEEVYYSLLPRSIAVVTKDGIKFKNALYICELAREENWLSHARNNGSWKIDISYDSRNTNFIYIHHENHFIQCFLLPHQETFQNVTFDDIDALNIELKQQNNQGESTQLSKNINLISTIKEKTDTISELVNQNSTKSIKSKKEKIENIMDNRKKEKDEERKRHLPTNENNTKFETKMNEHLKYKRKTVLDLGLYGSKGENN